MSLSIRKIRFTGRGEAILVDIEKIKTDERFDVFLIDDVNLSAVVESMRKVGFDRHHPLLVQPTGDGNYVLIEGRTRFRSAKNVGVKKVWITPRYFSDLELAEKAAVDEQLLRRNITPREIINQLEQYAKTIKRGRPKKNS